MKFYRHYKNKPYKFVGVAKHSETLTDLVVYECLYENPTAKLWVRPKEMFFESIEVDGVVKPRFEKVSLSLEAISSLKNEHIHMISELMKNIFGSWDSEYFHKRIGVQSGIYLLLARINGKPVGFKLGYRLDQKTFYSWLGGVLPEWRGLGVAQDLMNEQHQWCLQQGYTQIQTKTVSSFRDMIVLNLKSGFQILSSEPHPEGIKILFQKRIPGI